MKTILGIDLGSRNVKLCLMKDGTVQSTDCIETMNFYRTYGKRTDKGFHIDIDELGFSPVDRIVATGYGRMTAAVAGADNISELTAHYLGARYQTGLDNFTLLDMGGQDYKIMHILSGRIQDMDTKDKCAASTGRYLENMSGVLGIPLEKMGEYHDNPVHLTSTCAIFSESEIIGLIAADESVNRLAAGANLSVVERVMPLLERMGDGKIVMSGGVALNRAVRILLGDLTGREIQVTEDPLHNGAIGCCVRGMEG